MEPNEKDPRLIAFVRFMETYPNAYLKKVMNEITTAVVESDGFAESPKYERKDTVNFMLELRDLIT